MPSIKASKFLIGCPDGWTLVSKQPLIKFNGSGAFFIIC